LQDLIHEAAEVCKSIGKTEGHSSELEEPSASAKKLSIVWLSRSNQSPSALKADR